MLGGMFRLCVQFFYDSFYNSVRFIETDYSMNHKQMYPFPHIIHSFSVFYLNYGCVYISFTNFFTILYLLIETVFSMHCKRIYTFPHILHSFWVFLENVKTCENNSLLR